MKIKQRQEGEMTDGQTERTDRDCKTRDSERNGQNE
jgi:hypothetical protein